MDRKLGEKAMPVETDFDRSQRDGTETKRKGVLKCG